MRVRVFRGKNWKLASVRKWKEEDIECVLIREVGELEAEGETFTIHEIQDGYAAVEKIPAEETPTDPVTRHSYVVTVQSGVHRIAAASEGEAKNRTESIAKDRKALCTLHAFDGSKYTRVTSFDGRKK